MFFFVAVICAWSKAAGGTDIILKLQDALISGTAVQRLAWVDAHGYDGWPALACLQAGLDGLDAVLLPNSN